MSIFFDDFLESVQQMDEIIKGESAPSADSHIGAIQVKEIRKATGLTQILFALKIGIEITTLRKWEQGLCGPTGPAKTLLILMAIRNDPTPELLVSALQ